MSIRDPRVRAVAVLVLTLAILFPASSARGAAPSDIGGREPDTIGLYHFASNEFRLRRSNTTGSADIVIKLGEAGDLPVSGDWNGDGDTNVGVFRPATGQFLVRERVRFHPITKTVNFLGQPGDRPVIGDWDGDGVDSYGVFRDSGPTVPVFFLTNDPGTEGAFLKVEIQVFAGEPGDVPLAGDWDGDGRDSVGFYRPTTAEFFLVNEFDGVVDRTFRFGRIGDLPFAGDWNGDQADGVGVFRPSDKTMHLTNFFGAFIGVAFSYPELGDTPVSGKWDLELTIP